MGSGEKISVGEPFVQGLTMDREQARKEEELRCSPQVLLTVGSTLVDQYADLKSDDFTYTPDIVISEEAGPARTLFVGKRYNDGQEVTIFQRDEQGRAAKWITLRSFYDGTQRIAFTDGKGAELQKKDRPFVRNLLDKLRVKYDEMATEKADEFAVKDHALRAMKRETASKEESIVSLRQQIAELEQADGPFNSFRVTIISGWESEGEKSLNEVFVVSSLSDALRQAVAEFKKINGRSDVQAISYSASVVAGEMSEWEVPKKYIKPLFHALAAHDGEAAEIERVRKSK